MIGWALFFVEEIWLHYINRIFSFLTEAKSRWFWRKWNVWRIREVRVAFLDAMETGYSHFWLKQIHADSWEKRNVLSDAGGRSRCSDVMETGYSSFKLNRIHADSWKEKRFDKCERSASQFGRHWCCFQNRFSHSVLPTPDSSGALLSPLVITTL